MRTITLCASADPCACDPCRCECCGCDVGERGTCVDAQGAACDCCPPRLLGIAGGGTILTAKGSVNLMLFASNLLDPPDLPPGTVQPLGRLRWVDPGADLTLESLRIDAYGPMAAVETGRQLAGWTTVNGTGEYPFVLRAIVTDPPEAGRDYVSLLGGDAVLGDPATAGVSLPTTGFHYVVEGYLETGDLQLLRLGWIPAAGTVSNA